MMVAGHDAGGSSSAPAFGISGVPNDEPGGSSPRRRVSSNMSGKDKEKLLDSVPSGSFGVAAARSFEAVEAEESTARRALTLLQLLFSLVASVIFVFGLINKARLITSQDGWDEVFVVIGSFFVFPIASLLYETVLKYFPFKVNKSQETVVWTWVLRFSLFAVYCIQQGLFLTYLVIYSGPLCWIFLVADVALLLMMMFQARVASFALSLYVLVLAAKFAVFWPNLDQSNASANPFADRNNQFGPNGLLACLMLTIPIIQFPVLLSRLAVGMTITDAYTANMAAVFAHLLHYLDVLDLYQLGLERETFASDVQSMILIFVLMGLVSSNLYYISLFFNDDTVERLLRKLQPNPVVDALGGTTEANANDDTLLHYFVWDAFFVDLPYAIMRLVAFLVHGTRISTFLAKNLMMMASVIIMLMHYSKTRN